MNLGKGWHSLLYIVTYCTILHCISIHCTALHCIVTHCTVLHCIVIHYTVLHCIVTYRTALHCIVTYCSALYYFSLGCNTNQCTTLHCRYFSSKSFSTIYISKIIINENFFKDQLKAFPASKMSWYLSHPKWTYLAHNLIICQLLGLVELPGGLTLKDQFRPVHNIKKNSDLCQSVCP